MPALTAVTLTDADDGKIWRLTSFARASVMVRSVRNRMPACVLTTLPFGIVLVDGEILVPEPHAAGGLRLLDALARDLERLRDLDIDRLAQGGHDLSRSGPAPFATGSP